MMAGASLKIQDNSKGPEYICIGRLLCHYVVVTGEIFRYLQNNCIQIDWVLKKLNEHIGEEGSGILEI